MANNDNAIQRISFGPDKLRLFSLYIYYRLSLSLLLSVLFISGLGESFLGANDPRTFSTSSYMYVGFCSLSLLIYLLNFLKAEANHILFLLLIDFIFLILMIHASNSAIGGLGYLLLIPMAIGSSFLNGKTSVALAAFASILLIGISITDAVANNDTQPIFTAGITGTLLFITAISFRLFSKKIQSSEDRIQEHKDTAEYLQSISQKVIETIDSGIVIIDKNLNVLFINNAAQELLSNRQVFTSFRPFESIYKVLQQWQSFNRIPTEFMANISPNVEVTISFTELTDTGLTSLMLLIEDNDTVNKKAQQIKLASLGRLTSSIAHEIRNPLGAIGHASQLLDESKNMTPDDQELLNMILTNSKRINQIINNILQFSRRNEANPETINLIQWLQDFKKNHQSFAEGTIMTKHTEDQIQCRIDPLHLMQIMTNLVDNGLKHSGKAITDNIISIEVDLDKATSLIYLDVVDEGRGVEPETIDMIFEPFYTTKTTGSGLGLYLCKELCLANQASIIYFKKGREQKSCFRLTIIANNEE